MLLYVYILVFVFLFFNYKKSLKKLLYFFTNNVNFSFLRITYSMVQPNRCKDSIDYCSKLVIKTNLLIKLLILKSVMYSCKASNERSHSIVITPYASGNKSVILFLFFRESLIRFFRLFNLGLASLNTISFILLDLKAITKHSVRDRITFLSATRLKKSKRWKPGSKKSSSVKSSRRKVVTPVPRTKLSSKKVTTLRREYMLLYGRFLTFRQRKAKPQLPKKYKNRFLKRHSGITSLILRYRKIKLRSNSPHVKKGLRVPLKTNIKKFARLSFFLDTTFTKARAEMSIYKKKQAATCLAADRLVNKKHTEELKGGVTPINGGNKDVYKGKFRNSKTIRITTYRGLRIRKKILRSGREVQKGLNDAVRRFRSKTKQKPLQSLESFNRSTNGVMLDWIMGLGSRESVLLGKSRVLSKYKRIKLRIRRKKFRRRRKTFIKIRKPVRRRNLKKQIKLGVNNYINP